MNGSLKTLRPLRHTLKQVAGGFLSELQCLAASKKHQTLGRSCVTDINFRSCRSLAWKRRITKLLTTMGIWDVCGYPSRRIKRKKKQSNWFLYLFIVSLATNMLAGSQERLFFLLLFKCNPNIIKRFVAGFSPQRPGFKFRAVRVEFLVEKVALKYIFLRVFLICSLNYHTKRDTMLQCGRSRVRFLMKLLDFSIDLIISAELWFWGRLSL
jgi:hypothetical protein